MNNVNNQQSQRITLHLASEEATLELGKKLAPAIRPGLVIYLRGNLGAGKTTLVRGLMQGLGYPGKVKSPTFTLVELYAISRLNLYHIDFYRFNDPSEWRDRGFREYFDGESICLVEWPERAGDFLPAANIEIVFEILDTGRKVDICSKENLRDLCLEHIQQSPSQ